MTQSDTKNGTGEPKIRKGEDEKKEKGGIFSFIFEWIIEEILVRIVFGLFKLIWRAVRAAFHALTD